MTNRRALRVAVQCIENEIKAITVNANLYEKYGMPSGEKAYAKRESLREAIAVLEEMSKRPDL